MPDRTINTLKQAGYRAVGGRLVDEYGGVVQPRTVGELMNISAYNITSEDLVRYGVTPNMETFSAFDILIDLESLDNMKLEFNFQAIKCDNAIWHELKLALISALEQEMKTRTINVEINETDFSNLNTGFNIVMFAGDEWPELPPNRTFCIFLSTKFFPKYLGKMKFAGVTTPKLLLSGPKILIGKKEVFEKMKVRLDLYQSPILKKRNNYFKATVIDDTSWAEVIIKYVLEYIDQHPMPRLDN